MSRCIQKDSGPLNFKGLSMEMSNHSSEQQSKIITGAQGNKKDRINLCVRLPRASYNVENLYTLKKKKNLISILVPN